jgi:hypothetical protein
MAKILAVLLFIVLIIVIALAIYLIGNSTGTTVVK